MLALSIRQPWAYAILHLDKRIENRDWPLPPEMIGKRILLHSSKSGTVAEFDEAREFIEGRLPGVTLPDRDDAEEMPLGCVVGAMTIAGCREPLKISSLASGMDGWWCRNQYGFEFADVQSVGKPIPCRGMQRFFRVPVDVADVIRERFPK